MNPAHLLRSVRRVRRLSQRELADHAHVPHSTIDRIEAGRTDPRLGTLETILGSVGLRLIATNQFGRIIRVDNGEGLYDRGGRAFPAHLETADVGPPWTGPWWGWGRLAWQPNDKAVPAKTYFRRPEPRRALAIYDECRYNDAT